MRWRLLWTKKSKIYLKYFEVHIDNVNEWSVIWYPKWMICVTTTCLNFHSREINKLAHKSKFRLIILYRYANFWNIFQRFCHLNRTVPSPWCLNLLSLTPAHYVRRTNSKLYLVKCWVWLLIEREGRGSWRCLCCVTSHYTMQWRMLSDTWLR